MGNNGFIISAREVTSVIFFTILIVTKQAKGYLNLVDHQQVLNYLSSATSISSNSNSVTRNILDTMKMNKECYDECSNDCHDRYWCGELDKHFLHCLSVCALICMFPEPSQLIPTLLNHCRFKLCT